MVEEQGKGRRDEGRRGEEERQDASARSLPSTTGRSDARRNDVSKHPDTNDRLKDTSSGRADHVADGTGHLDAHEAGDADEEAKDTLEDAANHAHGQ